MASALSKLGQNRAWLLAAGRHLLNLALPPRCLACGTIVSDAATLCGNCWPHVEFIARPLCASCGIPLTAASDEDNLQCGACLATRPPWRRARSVFRYQGVGRDLILAFKHGDRLDAAPTLSRWLARAGAELLGNADLIVPVPLHRRRLFSRRYNQSAVLALGLGKVTGVPVLVDALIRTRSTPTQGGLDRNARAINVRGAIATVPERPVKGRRVVLVDDVLTTGATAGVCIAALKKAGAVSVDILTLARVTREE
jgi:ComF family protein